MSGVRVGGSYALRNPRFVVAKLLMFGKIAGMFAALTPSQDASVAPY
jgi:hypothetical protein